MQSPEIKRLDDSLEPPESASTTTVILLETGSVSVNATRHRRKASPPSWTGMLTDVSEALIMVLIAL